MGLAIGGVAMKHKSLFKKSMVFMIVPMVILSLLLMVVAKVVIENYFRDDSYNILQRALDTQSNATDLDQALSNFKAGKVPTKESDFMGRWNPSLIPKKSVQTSYIIEVDTNQFKIIGDSQTVETLELDKIIGNEVWPLKGESSLDNESIFYAISPVVSVRGLRLSETNSVYQIAYISEQYSSDLSKVVIRIFLVAMGVFMVIVSLILWYVFKHVTKRLGNLEQGATNIGQGYFEGNLSVEPFDEIGRLGGAMNHMSRQLELIQEEQGDHFQMISHELKTPIMVMQGYLDGLIHHQYPKGSKEASYKVLHEELNKLQRLTQDIILVNKLTYLSKNKVEMTELSLRVLFEEANQRMNLNGKITLDIEGDLVLVGDKDSWIRVVENLMSNNLRYAQSKIHISLNQNITIHNDGPAIETHLLEKIGKPFVKGPKGGSGLGMTILKNILNLYHFTLHLDNDQEGVVYTIKKQDK